MALRTASPFLLVAVRFLLAFLVLNLLALTGRQKLDLKGKPIRKLLILGLVQPVAYFIFETYGISLTSSAFSGVMLGLVPVAGLVIGRVTLGERPTLRQTVCAFLSIGGVVLTTVGGGSGAVSLPGVFLLLGAVITAALYTAVSRDAAGDFTTFERTYVMFAVGSAAFLPAALLQNWGDPEAWLRPLSSPEFWGSVIYLAVVSSVCAFLLLNYAMKELSVAKATIFANFAAVVSVPAGILILKDPFSPLQLLGVAVILLSVFGVSYRKGPAGEQG